MGKNCMYTRNIIIFVLILSTLFVAANIVFGAVQQPTLNTTEYATQLLDYASISIYVYEGESCACKPVPNEFIFAQGITTDHSTSGFTDLTLPLSNF